MTAASGYCAIDFGTSNSAIAYVDGLDGRLVCSAGLGLLVERLRQSFPAARPVHGDRFASVASGLALHAALRFGSAQPSSTAAIASPVASTLPVFRPATQSRPERTR